MYQIKLNGKLNKVKKSLSNQTKGKTKSFIFFQVDPRMMAALMASSSLINAGANTEEVSPLKQTNKIKS